MDKFGELIDKIKNHKLGDKKEAFSLYNSLCTLLIEKYGPVDKDFDDNPTKRGKEWLDIHHIMEYELDDIARRTENAISMEKRIKKAGDNVVVVSDEEMLFATEEEATALLSKTLWYELKAKDDFKELSNRLKELYPNRWQHITYINYLLKDLKPYNIKEKLVYANKIEHFLLHYLIDSIRGAKMFSGGPNYLWDECIALDYYGFEKEYMNDIKSNKEKYYSIMSSEEITRLYKKLIDWKKWRITDCRRYWKTINYTIHCLNEKKVSYVEDTERFFRLLDIIDCKLDDDTKNNIIALPLKIRTIEWNGRPAKFIKKHLFDMDGKTALVFYIHELRDKSFTVPSNVEKLDEGAFRCGWRLETITIPTTVKKMGDKVFTAISKGVCGDSIWPTIGPLLPALDTDNCDKIYNIRRGKCFPFLKTVIYKGSRAMWDASFSNVELEDINLVCEKL